MPTAGVPINLASEATTSLQTLYHAFTTDDQSFGTDGSEITELRKDSRPALELAAAFGSGAGFAGGGGTDFTGEAGFAGGVGSNRLALLLGAAFGGTAGGGGDSKTSRVFANRTGVLGGGFGGGLLCKDSRPTAFSPEP